MTARLGFSSFLASLLPPAVNPVSERDPPANNHRSVNDCPDPCRLYFQKRDHHYQKVVSSYDE